MSVTYVLQEADASLRHSLEKGRRRQRESFDYHAGLTSVKQKVEEAWSRKRPKPQLRSEKFFARTMGSP